MKRAAIAVALALATGMGTYGIFWEFSSTSDTIPAVENACSSCTARHVALQSLQSARAELKIEESE